MNTQQRIDVERKIVEFLFNTMTAHGWQVDYVFGVPHLVAAVEWTGAKVLDTVFSVDEATISFVKSTGRGRIRRGVDVILGYDGWDCVDDHSFSNPNNPDDDFEAVMQLVDAFAEQFQGG